MMRLSVSGLAFAGPMNHQLVSEIRLAGFTGVEIAPTKQWPDTFPPSDRELLDFLKVLRENDVSVSGLQSLLFGLPDLQLLQREDWPKILQRMRQCIHIGSVLGASILVFGSPKNRLLGQLSFQEGVLMAHEFFDQLDEELKACTQILTLEPNAARYGADFMTTYSEAKMLEDEIDSPMIRAQIDTGSQYLSGEDVIPLFRDPSLPHVHISEPDLILPPYCVSHASISRAIQQSNYSQWVVLETLSRDNSDESTFQAMGYIRSIYGEPDAV